MKAHLMRLSYYTLKIKSVQAGLHAEFRNTFLEILAQDFRVQAGV